jgi:hypothetical protein
MRDPTCEIVLDLGRRPEARLLQGRNIKDYILARYPITHYKTHQ